MAHSCCLFLINNLQKPWHRKKTYFKATHLRSKVQRNFVLIKKTAGSLARRQSVIVYLCLWWVYRERVFCYFKNELEQDYTIKLLPKQWIFFNPKYFSPQWQYGAYCVDGMSLSSHGIFTNHITSVSMVNSFLDFAIKNKSNVIAFLFYLLITHIPYVLRKYIRISGFFIEVIY